MGSEWVRLSHEADVEDDQRDIVQFIVWGIEGPGTCFDVDDAFVHRANP